MTEHQRKELESTLLHIVTLLGDVVWAETWDAITNIITRMKHTFRSRYGEQWRQYVEEAPPRTFFYITDPYSPMFGEQLVKEEDGMLHEASFPVGIWNQSYFPEHAFTCMPLRADQLTSE